MQPLKITKKLIFSSISIFLFFGILELGARVFEISNPPILIDFDGGFNEASRVFIQDPNDTQMMITQESKLQSFQKQKFMRAKPEGTLRVVALGESSINYLQKDFMKLEIDLKNKLTNKFQKVEIINAGGLSYGSQRLAIVAKEMLLYSPDLLLVYMGHNEFEELEQLHLISPQWASVFELIYHSAFVRFLSNQLFNIQIKNLKKEHQERILAGPPNVPRAWQYKFTKDDISERMKSFERNLEFILQMYQEKKIPILLGTVPSNLVHPYLPEEEKKKYSVVNRLIDEAQFESAKREGKMALKEILGRHQSSELENNIIRKVAKSYRVVLVDVEKAIEEGEPHHLPGETLFKDHCHLNENGNQILIQTYFPQIVNIFQ